MLLSILSGYHTDVIIIIPHPQEINAQQRGYSETERTEYNIVKTIYSDM